MDNIKIKTFEYILFKLLEWNNEVTNSRQNDVSILKALKLLFFVSAVNASNNNNNSLLDNIFTDFVAMPYGHVESDIYDAIKEGKLEVFNLSNLSCTKKEGVEIDINFNNQIKDKVDEAIESLRNQSPNLIKLSSFALVELSHAWYSWKYYFALAKKAGINSMEIPVEVIKNEQKVFTL